MAIICKKLWPEYYDDMASGRKSFEFRVADFDVKEGDTLLLEEWDPKTESYTGRKVEKKVSYVGKFDLDTFAQKELLLKHGCYILSLTD